MREKRDEFIGVCVTAKERQYLKQWAKEAHMRPSEFFRYLLSEFSRTRTLNDLEKAGSYEQR